MSCEGRPRWVGPGTEGVFAQLLASTFDHQKDMKKIGLNIEHLGVQSFDTMPASLDARLGTVHGREATEQHAASCHASFCDCPGGTTGGYYECDSDNCPSVNVAHCMSAHVSECCGGGRPTDLDEYGWPQGNCS